MSTYVHSGSADHPRTHLTLGEVRARIQADLALPASRRRDMASALSSLANALGQPAEMIAADPKTLRPQVAHLTPAMAGYKPGRWRNILSATGSALEYAGVVAVPGRLNLAPSAAWRAVLGMQEAGAHRHFNLWRFARYATHNGIEPDMVDDGVIERYRLDLEERSLVTEPDRAARDAARYWNMAAEAHEAWPQQRLTVPDNRDVYSLPWERYPDTLQRDVDAWCAWLGADDPFLERDFTPLKPGSIRTRRKQVQLLLGALVQKGVRPEDLADLAAVTTPAMAQLGLRYIWERVGKRATPHTFQMAGVVLMIARHWVKRSRSDLDTLQGAVKKLRPSGQGMSERTRSRLRAVADNPDRLSALLALPDQLILEARRAGPPSETLAQQVQTAVALLVLLYTPIRLANLRGLRLGTHLVSRDGGRIAISIPGAETKNGKPYAGILPAKVSRTIDLYAKTYRPCLAPGSGDWLFPGATPEGMKSDDGLRSQIRKAIEIRCGVTLTPHCFRALAGWMVLKGNPDAHGLVQRLLGHSHLATTMAYYTGLEQARAVESYGELLDRHRADAGLEARQPRRRRTGS